MTLHVLESVRFADSVWNMPPSYVEALRAEFPAVRFSAPALLADADAVLPEADIVLGWAVRAENFATATRLTWVHATAAGVGSLLFPAMLASDVVITNSRGLHADAMAEHAIGLMLAFVRKLATTPSDLTQIDADAVVAAGWDENALHDAIAITARAAFMQRLVEGHGFTSLAHETAVKHAKRRVELGYVNLYSAFRDHK